MLGTLLLTILIIIALVVGWHIIFPLIGGAIALTAGAWFIVVGAITAICIATLLLFIFTGVGIFILGLFVLIGTVLAVVFIPILFPILIPLFILFLFISLFRRRQVHPPKDK